MTNLRRLAVSWCLVLGWLSVTPEAGAQVNLTLSGPAQAVNCDTLTMTSRIQNAGATLNNLWLTNQLPPSGFVYVPGASTVTLPGGVVVTGAAADPAVSPGGTNLAWDFTAVSTPGSVSNLLISEVFYDPTNAVEDSYEWVEIYNPGATSVTLNGWSLRDAAPGQVDSLPTFSIAAGEFVIIAASTSSFFSVHPGYTGQVVQVADGALGSGLNNFGDGLFLRNASAVNVDGVSYGASTAAFNPPVPLTTQGRSLVRNPANNDSNTRNDWSSAATPEPGTGTVPVGLQNGGVITVVWQAEVACDAISGQFLSQAAFEQPPGVPGTASVTRFVTVSRPDLVVTKSPNLQVAGYGDTVIWTVRVENAGFGAAPNVRLTDQLGPGLVFAGFSIDPTNAVVGSNVTWDASVIPAFTSLAAGASVDLVVSAQVVACQGLFNSADATWRCAGLLAATNEVCENTANIGQTATATLQFQDRVPALSGSISPTNVEVSYCGNLSVTLYLTNAAGPGVGVAADIDVFAYLPDGWTYSLPPVIGDLLPGQSTSVVVTVTPGGDCPLSTEPDSILFYPRYFDGCDQYYYGPILYAPARVVNPPAASVTKQMPAAASTTFPVTVRFTYTNFVGTESVTLVDAYPQATNLGVANISAGGVLISNTVVWANLVPGPGSGVLTTRFDMVFLDPCGGPDTLAFNRITASTYTDCRGCEREVSGSGQLVPIRLTRASSCGGTGTGGCDYASTKSVSTNLTEACVPVTLTHTFANFTGSSLSNWDGVVFTSDLGGGLGYLGSVTSVQVLVDGSNLTSAISITQTNPSLRVDLSGLNATAYSNLASITTGLTLRWAVAVSTTGQVLDVSTLTAPPCGSETEFALWNVGQSGMEILLEKQLFAEACGLIDGAIEMNLLPGPLGTVGTNSIFPVYDVEVVLDLDADTNGLVSFLYVTNSTTLFNLRDLSGTPLLTVEPVLTSNRLVWSLGDLATNQQMQIRYRLQGTCAAESNGLQRAYVRYNNRCGDGGLPQTYSAASTTNRDPLFLQPALSARIEPELTSLVSTQLPVQFFFLNSGFGTVYNLRAEMLLPPNVVYGASPIAPSFVSATNVVWDFQITSGYPGLADRDGDGFYDDLGFLSDFNFWVTNYVTDCSGGSNITLIATHGCAGFVCATAEVDTATFVSTLGALITRATFPDIETLCATNPVEYSVRNSGLTVDYNVQAYQTLPEGITYVPGSSRVSVNGGTTNAIADPPGDGTATNPLAWTSAQIPSLAALNPNDQVTIYYDVYLGCDSIGGNNQFISNGRFTDNCGLIQSNRDVVSVLDVAEPVLVVDKNSALEVADLNETNVYTIVISHDALSAANVPSMTLVDTLPAAIEFLGASPAPDAVIGQTLIWSNATLNALVGDGVAPFTLAESSVTIVVTGRVISCDPSVLNVANVTYGCRDTNQCLLAGSVVNLITAPILTPPGLTGSLTLNSCGGTRILTVTNSGATAHGSVLTSQAPTGYVFVSASVTGEFNSAALNLVLGGAPVGRTATIDFTTAAASGATDVDDDRGDGLAGLDFGDGGAFTITYVLASDGTELDCLADPTDLDFTDPEQEETSSRSSPSTFTYTNLCGEAGSAAGSSSVFPDIPDPDIDLQPNSLIVTNGQVVTFTATVRNNAEQGNADNLHVRLRFAAGWTNLTLVSSNIVSSGTSALIYEQQGDTNVLISLPGVILDPVDDLVVLTFEATAVQGKGTLSALAEVVGECLSPAIIPACVFTNTLGEAPLADTMSGSVIGAVNGNYYGYDQDQTIGAGFTLAKTVRLSGESAPGGQTRPARVGEDLVYRLRAEYFGGSYSNVFINESLPTNLVFGLPVDVGSSLNLTGWSWSAASGVFTLPGPITNDSIFVVDIPVIARNDVLNQGELGNQTLITNLVDSVFQLTGFTNDPPSASTTVTVYEANLSITKSVNTGTNRVQAGDTVIFTNVIRHTGLSVTTAYDVVFSDTLPAGLTFAGVNLLTDGLDNDGDGATEEADEGTLISGSTITVTTNHNPALSVLTTGQSITIVFPALVQNQTVGTTLTNVSLAVWTSLDGVGTNGHERTGADGTNGLNNYVTTDPEPVPVQTLGSVLKELVSTTQTNTLDPLLTIGERATYRLRVDLPQGVVSNLVITDIVPPGLDFVGANTNVGLSYPGYGYAWVFQAGGPSFDTNSVVLTDNDPTPASSLTGDGSGSNIVFSLGTVTNVPDGVLTNDYVELYMEYVLLNATINTGFLPNAYSNANRATVSDSFTSVTVTSPFYRVAEHLTGLTKTVLTNRVDAGDVMTFSIIVTNATNALSAAYDVQVRDVLTNTLYDVSTITTLAIAPGWSATTNALANATELIFSSDTNVALAPGGRVTNRFSVAAAQTLRPNQRFTNRVELLASDTIYGVEPGGIADRDRTNAATVVLTVTNLAFSKALFATSETGPVDSTVSNVQVGEVVTYRFDVRLPETTLTNLVVTDDLPLGLGFILGSARADTNGFNGTLPALVELSPTGTAGTVAPNGSNVQVRFTGATVVTGDNDPTNNSFALFINAIVLNTNGVSGLAGSQTFLTNSATLNYTGNPSNAINSGTVVTPVIEPLVSITKTITNEVVDAGDPVEVVLAITNSGLASAYNLVIRDFLDPRYFESASVTNTVVPAGYLFAVETNDVVVTSDTNAVPPDGTLETGEVVEVRFTVTISSNVPPSTVFTNTARVASWDSILGTSTIDQQRVYGPTQAVDVLVSPTLALAKSLVGTSEVGPVDTTGTNVTIGETVTYRLVVTLPEGTITNLAVADELPAGMRYAGNPVVDSAGLSGTLPGVPAVANAGGNGDDVTFTFNGLTVVTGDNDAGNNSFSITFDAVVLDVASNDGLPATVDGDGRTILTNRATVTYAGNPSNATPSGVVRIPVSEPALLINKTMSGPSNRLVVLTLTVTNRGLSTAFDVAVTDLIRTAWFDTTTLTPVSVPTGFTYAVSGAPGDATVTFASDPASGQPTNSIEVGETVVFRFSASVIPGVTGRITNTAVVATNTTTDGPNPDERVEPPTNSTAVLDLPSFTVTKTRTSPLGRPADVGETVTFRLTVTNTGPMGYSSVSLTDTFDTAILAFASAVPAQTAVVGSEIRWANVGPLPVGRATNLFVNFTALTSTLPGDTTNTVVASLVTTNGLPLPPQTSSAPVAVAQPSYVLNKERVEPASGVATQGQEVVFRLSVTNNGEVGLSPVQLDDTYDPGILAFSSATPAESSSGPGSITWANVGPLPVGGTAVVTVRFSAVTSTWPDDTTNVVLSTVSTTNGTPLAPQTSAAPVRVANPQIGLTKLAGNAPDGGIHYTNAGADVVYTYIITNRGNTHLVSMTVTDDVLGVIGTVPGPLAPGAIATLFFTSSVPVAVTNLGVVVGTPSDGGGTPIPGLPPVRDEDDAIVQIFASLGNFVWWDVNADGVQDGGSETGIPDVVVTLYDANTNVLGITTTDVAGVYGFTNLVPGFYFVGFAAPSGLVPSPTDQGGDDTADSDASILTGFTALTQLASGENDPTWDAGFYARASLGNFVWLDVNHNGIQDGGSETGIPGVVVNLLTNGTVIASTTTDVNGVYAFTNLVPGSYAVGFVAPTGFEVTQQDQGGDDAADSDAAVLTGLTASTVLIAGENDLTWDAGLFQRASLGDFVWFDENHNGHQDGGSETGMPGVVVNLLTNGTVIASTTTDVNGAYAFTNLFPGTYVVEFVPGPGFELTLQNNTNDTTDSDADAGTGRTDPVTLVSGENNPTLDAGLFTRTALGDLVWLDVNGNGVQDGGSETGIPDVVVFLYDDQTNVVGTTTTDVSGVYGFTNLVPGTYFVGVQVPTGYAVTQPDEGGDDTLDSDVNPATGRTTPTVLSGGEYDPTWDAGLYIPARLGDFVWLDVNGDGLQSGGSETGIPSVVVNLLTNGTVIASTTTDVSGAYAFTNLPPGDYVVEFVPPSGFAISPQFAGLDNEDSDADRITGRSDVVTLASGENDPTIDAGLYVPASLGNFVWRDENANGLQDGGSETGLPGVVVNLLTNGTVIASTTTDVAGAYAFTNLLPGDYVVEFVAPVGGVFSTPDAGADTDDSDANPATGRSGIINLVSGENDPTIDAGIYEPASLGNFVWLDVNHNGVQDGGGETGMPDVVVFLYDGQTNVVGTTTTDVNGVYGFTNLVPGTYFVGFVAPSTFEVTSLDQGGDDTLDSDADVVTGRTVPTVLISGENDPTWDAGLFQRASLGNFVWLDRNLNGVQDGGGETGMPDVVVFLYDGQTNVVGTTTTDVTGAYAFTNLFPGTYFVGFQLPTNYQFTTLDLGGDDALDSDADQATGRTVPTVLITGENDLSWDAGLYQPLPGIHLIKVAGDAADGDVEYILPGTDVVYTYTIINTGNTYLTSVTVTDDVLGVIGTIAGPVAPGETNVLTNTALAVAADVTNVAVVVGTPTDEFGNPLPFLPPVRDDDPAIVDVVSPGYTLDKDRTSPIGRAAQVGEGVDFRITLVNTGDVTLVTVPVQDTYETAYLTFTGAVPSVVDATDDGVLDWSNVGPLPAGYSTTLVVRFVAKASSAGLDHTNVVVAAPSVPTNVPPVFPLTNDAPYDISQAGYLLSKVRTVPAGSARIGDAVTFEVTIVNTGDVAFVTLPVTDRYETVYLTFDSAVPPADDSANDGELVWTDVGPLPVGASTTLVVNFLAAGSSAGLDRTNTVTTWPTTPVDEPPVGPSTSQAPYQVSISGYLLTKTRLAPTNRPAVVLEDVVFALTVLNTGDVPLVTVPLEDTYETAYLAFSNAVPPVDDPANDGQLNWLDVGPLPAGASTSVVVTFQAVATTLGLDRTNNVVARPTTATNEPPVFPKTNEAPYAAQFGWLGDTVWVDLNSDGLPNENLNVQGLNGVRVRLYQIAGGLTNLVASNTTATVGGQRGYYIFTNLTLGAYLVEVDLTTVPSTLDVITTPRRINAQLTPNGFFINADFGFIAARPTEVSLMYFRGAVEDGAVRLTWATAAERENLGYHLYRATREQDVPERLTDALIPGAGTGAGQTYQWTDRAVKDGAVYFYWLEDVEYDGDTTRHGPVRVQLGESTLPGVPFLVQTGGVCVIRAATLAAAGLPVYSMNADEVEVRVNGQPVDAYASVQGQPLRATDVLLVYVPDAGSIVQVGQAVQAARMTVTQAGPSWEDGETWMGVAEAGQRLAFVARPDYVRYLLADFDGPSAWVLDVSQPARPRLLVGVESVRTAHGTGLYLSYGVEQDADCLAVTPSALQELRSEDIQP